MNNKSAAELSYINNKNILNKLLKKFKLSYKGNESKKFTKCIICGCENSFITFGNGRLLFERFCVLCNSLERHRFLCAFFEQNQEIVSKKKILEIAGTLPFYFYFNLMNQEKVLSYLNANIIETDTSNFYFDIVKDNFDNKKDKYDLIMHVHVLEHLKDDFAKIIKKINSGLSPKGIQILCLPFGPQENTYSFDISEIPTEIRSKRFGHPDHYLSIGKTRFESIMKLNQIDFQIIDKKLVLSKMKQEFIDDSMEYFVNSDREQFYIIKN